MTKRCGICSELSDREHAEQKHGAEDNSYLPAAASLLTDVFDFDPCSSRKRVLRRCPECGTYYLYETDYVYLVNGSEDEEDLTRLDPCRAEGLMWEAGMELVR